MYLNTAGFSHNMSDDDTRPESDNREVTAQREPSLCYLVLSGCIGSGLVHLAYSDQGYISAEELISAAAATVLGGMLYYSIKKYYAYVIPGLQ